MKVECTKENLINSITLVEKISGRNLTLPVLNCLLLEASKNKLVIRATNLDLGIELEFPCKVLKEGIIAIPGSILLNTLSHSYESGAVILETVNNNLKVSTSSSKTIIKSYSHEDFPTLPTVDTKKSFTLKTESIILGLRSVWYSASLSTIKPELSSVHVYFKDGKMVFVSTDSFRLAEKTVPLESVLEYDPFLIPIKNVPEIIRVLEQAGNEVEMRLNQNQIAFVFDKTYLTSRLIDGVFPDYKQIIPKSSTTEVVVLKQDLLNTLKKTTVFADKSNQVRFSVNQSKKKFTISSSNADIGETIDSLNAAINGEALDINFNHRYITDCFQSLNTDSVTLFFDGLSKPMIIKGISDNSFLYLVMPMNK